MTVIFNRYFSEVARYFREVAIEDKRKQVLKEETWKFDFHHCLSSPPTTTYQIQSPTLFQSSNLPEQWTQKNNKESKHSKSLELFERLPVPQCKNFRVQRSKSKELMKRRPTVQGLMKRLRVQRYKD